MKKLILGLIILLIVIIIAIIYMFRNNEDSNLTKVTLAEVAHTIFLRTTICCY